MAKNTASVDDRLRRFAAAFDRALADFAAPSEHTPDELTQAVRYALLAPGKRIRPYLLTRCCELTAGRPEDALPAAAAVECVHAFSLVHDDLPAMDDDDLRRGQPTCHRRFGEATAILAGDALVVLAFEIIGRHVPDPATAIRMTAELSRAAGWQGMIGGQAADMLGQSQPPDVNRAAYIHARKTASLFEAACRMGAIAAAADQQRITALGRYGRHIGEAFQIADDLLDLNASPEALGKQAGKDAGASKQTYPRCVGPERSRTLAQQAIASAKAALAPFGPAATDLHDLADFVLTRHH